MSDPWDPGQYERFREERQQPFFDLLSLVTPQDSMRVLDLGCGTGQLTSEMHRQLKAAATLGIDSSASMLAKAPASEGLRFERRRVEDMEGEFDLVFSNAVLHWLPDHRALFPRLLKLVAPGGQFAAQMPANQDHPTHVVADVIAREMGIEGVPRHLLPLEEYARILRDFESQSVRMQVYLHRLPSREAVIEWVKGTTLTDIKRRLRDQTVAPASAPAGATDRYEEFEQRYHEELMKQLPDEKPFLFTFKRILLVGRGLGGERAPAARVR